MHAIVRLTVRAFISSLDRPTLFFILIFPAFFIFVMGYAFTGIIPDFLVGGSRLSYPVFLASGAVTFTVINSGMTVGVIVWFDRKYGMYEQILMGPFRRYEYLASTIIATILVSLVSSGLAFLIALPVLIQGGLTFSGFLYAGLVLVAGSVLFGSIALILSVRLKSSESFQVFNNFIFFIILFTSSVFYPTELAPEPIRIASLLNPLTYLADIFRAGLLGIVDPLLTVKIAVLICESLTLLTAAVLMFNRIQV